jgi:hypothetical protein
MAINPYYTVEEIDGVRCSVVEKKVSDERAAFLKHILEYNKKAVHIKKGDDGSCIIGVEDLLFNPIYSVYNRSLRTPEGKVLTPAYWYQKQPTDEYYWNYK